MSTEMVQVTAADLSLVEQNSLNAKQLKLLLKKRPNNTFTPAPLKGVGNGNTFQVAM